MAVVAAEAAVDAVVATVAAMATEAAEAACYLFSGLVPSPEKPMSEDCGGWRSGAVVVPFQGRYEKRDLGHRCPRTMTLLHLGLRSL